MCYAKKMVRWLFCMGLSFGWALLRADGQVVQGSSRPLVVLVHGTVFPPIAILDPIGLVRGRVHKKSWYRLASKKLCKNKFYAGTQAFAIDDGVHKLVLSNVPDDQRHVCAHSFAAGMDKFCDEAMVLQGADYYAFGWNGLLTHEDRLVAGRELYAFLSSFEKGRPITILAHSYGGSVALNIACEEDKVKSGFFVENLFLYSTPMTVENKDYVAHPMFKNIFNIYSHSQNTPRLLKPGDEWLSACR